MFWFYLPITLPSAFSLRGSIATAIRRYQVSSARQFYSGLLVWYIYGTMEVIALEVKPPSNIFRSSSPGVWCSSSISVVGPLCSIPRVYSGTQRLCFSSYLMYRDHYPCNQDATLLYEGNAQMMVQWSLAMAWGGNNSSGSTMVMSCVSKSRCIILILYWDLLRWRLGQWREVWSSCLLSHWREH